MSPHVPGPPTDNRGQAPAITELRAVELLEVAAARTAFPVPQVLLVAALAVVLGLLGGTVASGGGVVGFLAGAAAGFVVFQRLYREAVGYEPTRRVRADAASPGMWLRASGRSGGGWQPGRRLVRIAAVHGADGARIHLELSDGSTMDLAAYAMLPRVSIVIPVPRPRGLSRVGGRRWSRGPVSQREDMAAGSACAYARGRAQLPSAIACPPCSGTTSGRLTLRGGRLAALCAGHTDWLHALR